MAWSRLGLVRTALQHHARASGGGGGCGAAAGFTLMELMIVVVILAIVAAMAYPALDFIEKRRLVAATDNLHGQIQFARMEAIKQSRNIFIVTMTANNGVDWCLGISDKTGDRICVGDPTVNPNTTLWTSRHPALATIRQYRGYRFVNTVKYEIGIGIDPSTQVYTAATFTAHHFFMTPINGTVDDAKCEGVSPDILMLASVFTGNQGKNYCMTGNCPGETPVDPVLFVLSGKIFYT